MKKWEEKYNQYASGELESQMTEVITKATELEEKSKLLPEGSSERIAISKEYKECYKRYDALRKVRENMSKIANILEFRDKIQKDIDEVEAQIKEVKDYELKFGEGGELDKLNNESLELGIKLEEMMAEKETLQKELKNPELADDKKSEMEGKLSKLNKDIDENNASFSKVQSKLAGYADIEKPKASIEDLEAKKTELYSKRSKCNMVAKNLVNGYSWDSISMNLDKWQDREFTSKKPLTKMVKKKEKSEEKVEPKAVKTATRKVEEKEPEEVLPEKVSKFDLKHPKFAAFKNKVASWFRTTFGAGKVEKAEVVAEGKAEIEKTTENMGMDKKDEFKEYLKQVAEKGYKETDKENAQKKFEEMKKEAHKRETEKFGKDYADKSYKVEDGEER